jgi:citrate synthase
MSDHTSVAAAEVPTFVTAVSQLSDEFSTLSGYGVDDLAKHCTFTDAIFLAMCGELPTESQRLMLDRMLVLETAHGIAPTGALARAYVACGTPIQVALAGGALAVGDVHGGAGEQVGQIFQERGMDLVKELGCRVAAERLVGEMLADSGRVPGFGHQFHKDGDPRALFLLNEARALNIAGPACELLWDMEDVLAETKRRRILTNVDGAIAAILTDMQIDWRFSRPLMVVSRQMTLAAIAVEAMQVRVANWRDLMVPGERYVGPERRAVPN